MYSSNLSKSERKKAIKFIREHGTKVVNGETSKFYEFVNFADFSDAQIFEIHTSISRGIVNPD